MAGKASGWGQRGTGLGAGARIQDSTGLLKSGTRELCSSSPLLLTFSGAFVNTIRQEKISKGKELGRKR